MNLKTPFIVYLPTKWSIILLFLAFLVLNHICSISETSWSFQRVREKEIKMFEMFVCFFKKGSKERETKKKWNCKY